MPVRLIRLLGLTIAEGRYVVLELFTIEFLHIMQWGVVSWMVLKVSSFQAAWFTIIQWNAHCCTDSITDHTTLYGLQRSWKFWVTRILVKYAPIYVNLSTFVLKCWWWVWYIPTNVPVKRNTFFWTLCMSFSKHLKSVHQVNCWLWVCDKIEFKNVESTTVTL